jgi:glutathione peroxidase-family protein
MAAILCWGRCLMLYYYHYYPQLTTIQLHRHHPQEKIDVNGPNTHPVYQYLKGACASCAGDVTWNFSAFFVISRKGEVVERSQRNPLLDEAQLAALLAESA